MLSCFACLKLYIVYGYWRQLPIPWRFPSITYMHFDLFLFFLFAAENSMILNDVITADPIFLFDLYIFIYWFGFLRFTDSLYQEGDSNRISTSAENHIEFSALKLHCPVDSPPFHFPFRISSRLLIDDLTRYTSCNTSLLFREALSSSAGFSNFDWYSYQISTDSFCFQIDFTRSDILFCFLKPFLVRLLWCFFVLKICLCFFVVTL